MKRISDVLKDMEQDKKTMEFIPTGFVQLDSYLDGGFLKKELNVLGAYTGVGKSFVAGTIAHNVSRAGFKVGYYSLEISNTMIVSRILGQITDIKPTKISYGMLYDEQKNVLTDAKAELAPYDNFLYLSDDLYKLEEIESSIKQQEFDFIVVDFIQNIIAEGQEYERLSNVSLSLQQLAKTTNSCILVLSQLSNEAAKRGYMEYKGSGSIQTVCDLGMFLERETLNKGDTSNRVKLIVKKNRRGYGGKEIVFEFQQPGGK